MPVRAKFKVTKIEDAEWSDGKKVRTVTLGPAYADSEENKSFFAATPSGSIQLGCANLEAAKQFTHGQEFYVDFTPAE